MIRSAWAPAVIAAAVVVADRITKLYIQAAFAGNKVTPVIPGFFYIDHAENPGAAFSMFAESSSALRGILLVGISLAVMIAIAVMLWGPGRHGHSGLMRAGLSLVLGGALGNCWDRVLRGTVTDFIQVFLGRYEFPSFNLADSMITIGACLLIIDLFLTRHSLQSDQRA